MPGPDIFEYAVIRVMPRAERGEFLNVGVILYCKRQKFLGLLFSLDEQRLGVFSRELDLGELQVQLEAFTEICRGTKKGGPIAMLEMAERFRWLTAARSTVLQGSAVHPGLCTDAGGTLEKLYAEMVLSY
ncbi:DUF3037 domain-containing protein [Hufsiella ginkgonis]|uniref:DUF3037 domain-containing protein n=1 Tax=Hufsiella ginkgonis TaxID=2695274 RepID=A0A7K1XXK8_9SPHI|nr:DUF3037 domain-containing protein [Hufsiella ginkgonis]MXV15682.1 DUF3037 domain-containing protein [Hufsiella ginkgonis]